MILNQVTKEQFSIKKQLPFQKRMINFCTPSIEEYYFEDGSYGQIQMNSLLPESLRFGQNEDIYKLSV